MSPTEGGMRGGDVPDSRGRTGLHHVGLGLNGNSNVSIVDVEVVSDGWHVLRRTTIDYRRHDGSVQRQQRETYDRGNGATLLLHDPSTQTVLLTRQFRFPAYVSGHPDGMLIEAAAGLLDDDSAEDAIRREAAEELGVSVGDVRHLFDLFMSPGSVTERVHFFEATVDSRVPRAGGGGIEADG